MPAGPAFTTTTLLAVLGLATAAIGAGSFGSAAHARNPTSRAVHARRIERYQTRASVPFTLAETYQGNNFFDGFTFYSDADPTHGLVDYVPADEAFASNLTFINGQGQAVMRVDKTTYLQPGQPRKSVRLHSKNRYGNSLIVLDLAAMPHGCSVWPAYWMMSGAQQWPNGGEIDILEGVNEIGANHMTLHTRPGCTLDRSFSKLFTGSVAADNCDASANNNAGCGVVDPDAKSWGHEMNINGGSVFATLTDDSGVRIWRFNRNEVPQDLLDEGATPDPESWPLPKAFWAASTCTRDFIDQEQMLIFDITLCGDWAGATFNSDGCSGSCADMVMDPKNYIWARFIVNSLRVFKHA
ncbi:hypothetical protein EXIGLDRAFT_651429 [Exidia glandulosa HHB12029]|uniref:GH16 domain-containing protein n=1 Tax=Exidia glandulosa HHB12029 TaxID=1314781 RepID=A0A165F213_EXIGL|nr:hypothetical protein EXIGLDRAFT_651429 [Exidia glandulosa HHB12029]